MTAPRLLDMFCCEGGASVGYHRAGFDVFGVDLFENYTRSRYPFKSAVVDAIEFVRQYGHQFHAIAASPPCQRYSITNAARGADYPDLIAATRDALVATGRPYIIENVVGAPLVEPVELCGCMFGMTAIDTDGELLHLRRRRLFESNVTLSAPSEHDHDGQEWVGGCYGGARRDKHEAKYERKGGYVPRSKAVVQALMGIDWMTWKGMHQAIPPSYTQHLGRQLLTHISEVAA